jgi:hypothetical protein
LAANKKKVYQYQLATGIGIQAGIDVGPVGGLSGSIGRVYIWRKEKPLVRALYGLYDVNAGVGFAKISLATLASDPSDFESPASGLDQFRGPVTIIETASVQAGAGYSWQGWYWEAYGPAQGTVCEGWGASFGIALGVNFGSKGVYNLTFAGIEDGTYKMPAGPAPITRRGPR